MYYGNAGAGNQQDVAGTWDSNYEAVWHFNGTGDDSTANDVDLTAVNGPTYNLSGNGFIGGNTYLTSGDSEKFSHSTFLDTFPVSGLTFEFWSKPTSISETMYFFRKRASADDQIGAIWWITESKLRYFCETNGAVKGVNGFDGLYTVGNWHYIAHTFVDNTPQEGHHNRSKVVQADSNGALDNGVYDDWALGSSGSGSYYNGAFDEFRVSGIRRSDDWLNTTYNTTAFGYDNGFFSVGAEELAPAGDDTPPHIIINFAGDLSDSGGPYWRPPDESTQLTGAWSDGYYTNSSCQSENWMYINLTVNDSESAVSNVWLQWLNETTWTNWSYAFVNTGGDYWEYNTSGNVPVSEGYNYSFNIVANNSGGATNTTWWNKTALSGSTPRRYVQLNCAEQNISYYNGGAFYLKEGKSYILGDYNKKDVLKHDQGIDGGDSDTGILDNTELTDTLNVVSCLGWIGFWFDESICIQDTTINNVYYHFWFSTQDETLNEVGFNKSRENLRPFSGTDTFTVTESQGKSNMTVDNGLGSYDNNYSLCCKLDTISNWTKRNFTDNSIYELVIQMDTNDGVSGYVSSVSNRSVMSFVIFNVPDNTTLKSHDNDSDGLNNWEELFVTYTNPFVSDTDNDGATDYEENETGSDPNNYTDTKFPPATFTSFTMLNFSTKADVTQGTADADLSPNTWDGGTPNTGVNIMENFTYYQNGTAILNVTIGFNDTNYTYTNWATYNGDGHDQYTANFTIDNWATETNIVAGYPPTTILNDSVQPTSNFTFGVRLWIPKSISSDLLEDFLIVAKESVV